jgi:hypothetical protein
MARQTGWPPEGQVAAATKGVAGRDGTAAGTDEMAAGPVGGERA